MDVRDAIRTVLAVRTYRDEPVAEEVIREILEAGRLTASAGNRQPWTFVVVTDREALQAFGDLIETGPFVARAAFAIAVVADKSPLGISDASRAVQNMVLLGAGGRFELGWIQRHAGPHQAAPRHPRRGRRRGVGPFGYPAGTTAGKGTKKRKPLDQVVRWGSWDPTSAP